MLHIQNPKPAPSASVGRPRPRRLPGAGGSSGSGSSARSPSSSAFDSGDESSRCESLSRVAASPSPVCSREVRGAGGEADGAAR